MQGNFEKEKRRYPRLERNWVIAYNTKDVYDISYAKNISPVGVLFTASYQFEEGQNVKLIVKFPFLTEKVEVMSRVVGLKKIRDNLYEVRAEFLNLPENVQKMFTEFMKHKK